MFAALTIVTQRDMLVVDAHYGKSTQRFELCINQVLNENITDRFFSCRLPIPPLIKSMKFAFRDLCLDICEFFKLNISPHDLLVCWVDDEGDYITMSSESELFEAVRILRLNHMKRLEVHVSDAQRNKFQHKRIEAVRRKKKGNIVTKGLRSVFSSMRRASKSFTRSDSKSRRSSLEAEAQREPKRSSFDTDTQVKKIEIATESKETSGNVVSPHVESKLASQNIGNQNENGSATAPPIKSPVAAVIPEHRKFHSNDFELKSVLGRGSYAKVLLAEEKESHKLYAIKVMKKELVLEDDDTDWVVAEREVFRISQGCPFLVHLYSCFQTNLRLLFVMEFVPGGDMMFHMQALRRLPEDTARFYAAEVTVALHYLHERGIIYRDLKLDNVLLDREGHIKITDYGMCRTGLSAGETTNTFCGTPSYIAPEILREVDYSYSVDWWTVGILLYEMLVGRPPFEASTEESLWLAIMNNNVYYPSFLSHDAIKFLEAMLAKDPNVRLGCDSNTSVGYQKIQDHTFFSIIDWPLLLERKATPPFIPDIQYSTDVRYFDKTFTSEAPILSPTNSKPNMIDQNLFRGFSFNNLAVIHAELNDNKDGCVSSENFPVYNSKVTVPLQSEI